MSTNVVVLGGRLGADPEVKSTSGGKSIATFNLAVSNGFGDKKTTDWWNVQAWDRLAESLGKNVVKGARVTVTGRLTIDSWEDSKTGEKKSRPKIVASSIEIIDFPIKDAEDENAPF